MQRNQTTQSINQSRIASHANRWKEKRQSRRKSRISKKWISSRHWCFISPFIKGQKKHRFRFYFKIKQQKSQLLRLGLFSTGHGANNIRISRVGDGKTANTEKLSTGRAQFNVGSGVIMDAGLGEHRVIFNLRFSAKSKKIPQKIPQKISKKNSRPSKYTNPRRISI